MAVEARHLNLFRPPVLGNQYVQGLMVNGDERNGSSAFGAQMAYGVVAPLSGITTATDAALPIYCSTLADTFPVKTAAMKSENWLGSGVAPVSRKRARESVNPILSSYPNVAQNQSANNRCSSFNFLGEDITLQIHQQRMEMDRLISQHAEKVRMEMEERQRRFSRRMAAAVKENILTTVKEKEDQLEKIGKLNWALEERVKSLSMENQIWRDLAHTNEAKANALRSDLEQVLAQVQDEQQHPVDAADDAESCCNSNFEELDGDKHLRSDRICRSCGKEESCVLLLPCRHLCLCTQCGSSLHACPVCNSGRTASLHINLS
ncbi:probable BOI-related E3 ubiquitin-protein ligase 3 isoform X1 [Primulina huaijiensis]|uniref:probable BOI-related E3 ubiquitin-protein ligase 3 isoform X1 n=1 Tax=Primulina huaijiensis TaxID=1492673 RepID=UPI003CC707B1